jgi:hypothetical protein
VPVCARRAFVQAAIEIVRLRQRDVLAEQIAHRAMLEPLPMQPPLAAGEISRKPANVFSTFSQLMPSREGGNSGRQNSSNSS